VAAMLVRPVVPKNCGRFAKGQERSSLVEKSTGGSTGRGGISGLPLRAARRSGDTAWKQKDKRELLVNSRCPLSRFEKAKRTTKTRSVLALRSKQALII